MLKRQKALKRSIFFILSCVGLVFGGLRPSQAFALEPMDFSESFKVDDHIKLEGPWEFYWQELLVPGDRTTSTPVPMKAGTYWNSLNQPGSAGQYPAFGFGTYRLRFKGLSPRKDGYELFIRSTSSAYRAYIFMEGYPERATIIENGHVGDEATTEPFRFPQGVQFAPGNKEEVWVALIQIANFHDSKGGLWHVPSLAPGSTLSKQYQTELLLNQISAGMIFIIGVYNFMIYLRRRQDTASLMLGCWSFLVAIRTFVTSDLTSLYFPELGSLAYFIKYKVEYLTMLACTLSGIAFFYFNFGAYLSQKLFKVLTAVFLGSMVLVAILPLHFYTQLQRPFHVMLISSLIYVLVLILQAWRHRAEMVVYAFLGAFILTLSFVYDILVTYRVMPFPYTMNLAMVVFIFLQSQMVAHRFAKAFRTAEHLQKELQREVERQTEEIRSIMEHVPQGIFILLPDLSIQGQYARQLEHILGYSELQGRAALPLIYNGTTLSAEQKALIESTLVASFGGSDIFWSMNDHLLPKELYRKDKNGQTQIIEAEWYPIVNKDGCIARVLVTLRNVTQVRRLQEESAQHQAEMSMLIELAQVEPDVLGRFAEQSRRLLLRARELLMDSGLQPHDRSHAIFILLHTWKGNARSLSLRLLTSAIHDAEQLYVAQFKDSGEACNVENCLNQLSQLEEILDRYLRLGRDKFYPHRSKNSIPVQRGDLVKIEDLLKHPTTMDINERLRRMTRHLQDFVGTHLYRSLSSVLTELKEEAASLARELGKPQPDLHVDVPPVWLMQQAEENLRHAFLHMIRNSMDHGIEDTVTRVKLGKSPAGSIRIYATSKGPDLEISYEDDGKGLDLQRIDQRAKAANIIRAETSPPVADLVEIIFHPGFSTAEQVSEISGRGIGMSAIRCFVTDLGGTMTIEINQRKLKALESVPFRIVILVPHRNCTLWTQELAA